MSFLLGFFLEATLGMIGFWFLEINSLLFVFMLLNFFFSGHMFPIDMLPGVWGTIVKLLPLQYLAYFPAAVFLGKVQPARSCGPRPVFAPSACSGRRSGCGCWDRAERTEVAERCAVAHTAGTVGTMSSLRHCCDGT